MNTKMPKAMVLMLASLFLIYAGCSDDDKPTPDKGPTVDDGGLDGATDGPGGDGPADDGPAGDGPVPGDGPAQDQPPTPDQTTADLPPASSYNVVVTEIMANPTAVSDGAGEWLELHNAGTAAVDLEGWTIKDDDKDSHVISSGDAGASLTIAPGGYVVLAKNKDSTVNGGVTAIYQYDDLFLANSSDEIVLLDETGKLVDRIVYSSSWKLPGAASFQLKSPSLDNNVVTNWCEATTAWSGSAGDFGSPGAANTCAGAPDGGTDMPTTDTVLTDTSPTDQATVEASPADMATVETSPALDMTPVE